MFNLTNDVAAMADTLSKMDAADKAYRLLASKGHAYDQEVIDAMHALTHGTRQACDSLDEMYQKYKQKAKPANIIALIQFIHFISLSREMQITEENLMSLLHITPKDWSSYQAERFEFGEALASVGFESKKNIHTFTSNRPIQLSPFTAYFIQRITLCSLQVYTEYGFRTDYVAYRLPLADMPDDKVDLNSAQRLSAFRIPIRNMAEYWQTFEFVAAKCPSLRALVLTFDLSLFQ